MVCPSSANSLVGIKPTVGLVSRAGIIPISHSQDTAGPMARTVGDAAILLNAMAGVDTRDETTNASRGKAVADYTQFLDKDGLRGVRLGIARKHFGFNERTDKLMNDLLAEMKKLGAVLVDPAIARQLRVAPGSPALQFRRWYYGSQSSPFLISSSIRPAERFTYRTKIVRRLAPIGS